MPRVAELLWKVDGRMRDVGQCLSEPCCNLLHELLPSGRQRAVTVGEISYIRFRR